MKASLISCIVPVFNGERFLKETVDSILAQTYRPLEIIICDDGSTDRTAQVVAGYGDQVRYFWQENGGPATARNLGLSAAQGEFVAFLDADDLWHAQKLERQMFCFQNRSELDLCITHLQNFWIPELYEEEQQFLNHRMSKPFPGYCCQALMARRAFFEFVGHFDPSFRHAHDTEWFMRSKEHRAVIEILPDVLVHRRLHQSNFSRREASESRQEYLQMIKHSVYRRRILGKAASLPPDHLQLDGSRNVNRRSKDGD